MSCFLSLKKESCASVTGFSDSSSFGVVVVVVCVWGGSLCSFSVLKARVNELSWSC